MNFMGSQSLQNITNKNKQKIPPPFPTQTLNVWTIYLQDWVNLGGFHVGK